MTRSSFVIGKTKETIAEKRRSQSLLLFQVVGTVAIALSAPVGVTVLMYREITSEDGNFLAELSNVVLRVSYASIDYLALFLIAIFGLSAVIGIAFGYSFFVVPVRRMRAWITAARETSFGRIGPFPNPGGYHGVADDVRSALAFSIETKERNTLLSRQQSDFITIASHQLRTPLTGLLWSIDSLSKEQPTENLTKIGQALRKLAITVQNIIAVADMEEGRFGYSFTNADLLELAQGLVNELRPIAAEHSVEILFEHPDTLQTVYMDADRIRLTLYNLLSNGIDYTPRGGSVTLKLEARPHAVAVSVRDTGIGIAERELPLIFNKFYRSDQARHMKPDGSGAGLYLAKNIVQKHASALKIESEKDKGSLFSFELPYQRVRTDS